MTGGRKTARAVALACAVLFLASEAWSASAADARAIHERILALDSHLDTPLNLGRPGWDITAEHSVVEDLSQLDYPRMVKGGLDGGFFAIFTPQGPRNGEGYAQARNTALRRASEIRDMVARHGDKFALALRAEDAARIADSGRRIVFMSMENAYPLGTDLGLMRRFYDLGVRMIGPIHFSNNDFGDSATDARGPEWGGLSPLGKAFVAKANRLGIVIDASHASDLAFDQMLELSSAPIVLSHSGASAIFAHPRNIDDARIRRLAAKGGVIQINSYPDYLMAIPRSPARSEAMRALTAKYGPFRSLSPERFREYMAERRAIEAQYPLPRPTIDHVMAHLLHALKLVGPDHVGIGLDFDGGGGVAGLEDVADMPEISRRLLDAGYTEADLAKIWGGNLLRVVNEAETRAAGSAP